MARHIAHRLMISLPVLLGVLLIVAHGSALSPFLYAIF